MGVPGNANTLLLKSAAAGGGAYQVSRSLRFNSADSAYLNRTPASAGNRKTWTWAGWVKRSKLTESDYVHLFGHVNSAGSVFTNFIFKTGSDSLQFFGNSSSVSIETANLLRDVSAWYHLVLAVDTTQATASGRAKIYINGVEAVYATDNRSSTISQNADLNVNNTVIHEIGGNPNLSATRYFNGYLADIHFLDGIATDPSSFTTTDLTTGQLIPKAYTGSYGTNGFKLDFSSNATTAALGTDTSGNGNTWTVNNLSVTAGSGNDSLVDTPTSYGTDTGVGNEVRGNYTVLNALNKGSNVTLSNGNLESSHAGSNVHSRAVGTIGVSSNKWYFEATLTTLGGQWPTVGVAFSKSTDMATFVGAETGTVGYYAGGGANGGGGGRTYSTYTTGDVIGVAIDLDNSRVTFYKNGANAVTSGTTYESITAGEVYVPAVSGYGSSAAWVCNYGQRAFAYTAPSGFKALCDTNLPAPVVAKGSSAMDVKLYTATDGVGGSISGVNFSPDFVWIKSRAVARSNVLMDTVRGTSSVLWSDLTDAQLSSSQYVSQFNSDGFNYGVAGDVSNSSTVAWMWDAGTATVSNTQGSITSSVRANATAGFSVVSFTGTSSSGTIGHGLGVAPGIIIVKCRSTGGTGWPIYHQSLGGVDKVITLQSTGAVQTISNYWNSSAPSSTTFGVASGYDNNVNGATMIAYCFAPVSGYSNAFTWSGTGSTDGPAIYLGFRPKLIIWKRTDSAANWAILDSSRSSYNVADDWLGPNSSSSEAADNAAYAMDFLSNGLKIRATHEATNQSGGTYIGFAWAESPFQYARAR